MFGSAWESNQRCDSPNLLAGPRLESPAIDSFPTVPKEFWAATRLRHSRLLSRARPPSEVVLPAQCCRHGMVSGSRCASHFCLAEIVLPPLSHAFPCAGVPIVLPPPPHFVGLMEIPFRVWGPCRDDRGCVGLGQVSVKL